MDPEELRQRSIRDQYEAATEEVREAILETAIEDGVSFLGDFAQKPAWWPTKVRAGCSHLEHPRPIVASFAAPDLIFCADCYYPIQIFMSEALPDLCERCFQPTELFTATSVQGGPLLVAGELCPKCHADVRMNR
jgi:hypothetical protein